MGLPGLTGLPQPGTASRSGKSYGTLLFKPRASPETAGVNGRPSETCRIVPNCQPRSNMPRLFTAGTSQIPLIVAVRPTLKSEGPRRNRGSKIGRFDTEFV